MGSWKEILYTFLNYQKMLKNQKNMNTNFVNHKKVKVQVKVQLIKLKSTIAKKKIKKKSKMKKKYKKKKSKKQCKTNDFKLILINLKILKFPKYYL